MEYYVISHHSSDINDNGLYDYVLLIKDIQNAEQRFLGLGLSRVSSSELESADFPSNTTLTCRVYVSGWSRAKAGCSWEENVLVM